MRIDLQKSELEKFLALSSYVAISEESVSFLPISEYILFNIKNGFCKMTLTSPGNFVVYMFNCGGTDKEDFLISYFDLKKFYSNKRGDQLIISEKKMTDGNFNATLKIGAEIKIEEFPSIPDLKDIKYSRIDKQTIEQLKVSKKYIMPETKDKLRPILNVSSIKGGTLLASDAIISCLYSVSTPLDFAYFNLKEIGVIGNFEYFDYGTTENWNVIKYKTILYGTRLVEGLVSAGQMHETISSFVGVIEKEKVIRLNVEQFYDFCKSVKSYVKDETVNSYLTVVSSDSVSLSYVDIANDIDCHQPVSSVCIGYEPGYKICLVQSEILKVLDSLEDSVINLSECYRDGVALEFIGFWLETDPSYHSICSKGFENKTN